MRYPLAWVSVADKVRTKAWIPGFRFYDLRHTGNTLAAKTGAGLADLMAHTGHASVHAAMIYRRARPALNSGTLPKPPCLPLPIASRLPTWIVTSG